MAVVENYLESRVRRQPVHAPEQFFASLVECSVKAHAERSINDVNDALALGGDAVVGNTLLVRPAGTRFLRLCVPTIRGSAFRRFTTRNAIIRCPTRRQLGHDRPKRAVWF